MSALDNIVDTLRQIHDPRRDHLKEYPLDGVIFLVLCATLGGVTSFTGIVTFGEMRLAWLQTFFAYENGIPSHDTIRSCVGIVDKKALQTLLKNLVAEIRAKTGKPCNTVAFDGKVLARSATAKEQQTKKEAGGKSPLKVVSAFANELRAVLGVESTEGGSEPDALLRLLEDLDITGMTATLDAAYAYHPVLEGIKAKNADFFVAVKENQPKLFEAIQVAFCNNPDIPKDETFGSGHGRHELRTVGVLDKSELPESIRKEWPLIEMIVEIESVRVIGDIKNEASVYMRYYMASRKTTEKKAGEIARGHWGIENTQHWNLDVQFHEDSNRQRTGNIPFNMGIFRRVALTILLNNGEGEKVRLIDRKRKCLLCPVYMEKTLSQAVLSKKRINA